MGFLWREAHLCFVFKKGRRLEDKGKVSLGLPFVPHVYPGKR